MTPYTFTRQNRTPRVLAILLCIYGGLIALVVWFDAVWWLIAPLALTTLPAVWDFVQGTKAGLSVAQDTMSWFTGPRKAEVNLADIDHVRMDTRWDFSVRVSLVLNSEKKIRLPDESTPPHRVFEQVLQATGLRVERHHFTVF
ncbi:MULTISPECIES: hypothetical protein [unclassified Ruegeria]|uniref:hypothetical protein n=1 Tax=unclassified Ruegeria TaxID=2625375 RepID=UPI001ADA80B8|nr:MULTISPECIES: hypothetical protein [unclassified Ruegeria]MBO9411315.1 hypothetical protein [Ruegeria sp. R8_1]MBO9415516.1 hypothetical protein [Ruegeria sp. R8_2]